MMTEMNNTEWMDWLNGYRATTASAKKLLEIWLKRERLKEYAIAAKALLDEWNVEIEKNKIWVKEFEENTAYAMKILEE